MTPNSTSPLKSQLFDLLPTSVLKSYFQIRGYEKVINANLVDDVYIPVSIDKDNKLWIDRLSKKHGHEIGICNWLKNNLKPNDVFFDVGSCFGFFPLLISKIHPEVEIHTFQPINYNYYFLKINSLKSTSKKPWKITNKFLGEQSFDHSTITLDEYCKLNHVIPTLVKMDVDGPEVSILKGARNLIQQKKTEFLVEVHPNYLKDYNSSIEEFISLIPKDYSYKILAQLRDDNEEWSEDLGLLNKDDNPYVYFAPNNLSRFR